MPSPLTEAHRRQQLALRAATLRDLVRLWPALDWARLDATYPAFAVGVARLVGDRRRMSAGLSAAYLRAFRAGEGVPGEVQAVLAAPLAPERLDASLRTTAVVSMKKATSRGVPVAVARRAAFVQTAGAVSRHVMDGGRATIVNTVAVDPVRPRYTRVTDGNPCAFCALMASRGAVYASASTAGFDAHDSCGCVPEPVYGDYTLPPQAQRWDDLYQQSTEGKSGRDALRAFEAAYRKAAA